MGESVVLPEPQQKPSRFQFVPVPGEFNRGRWKCRDSVRPYAETLEFDKSGSKNEPNPNKITVSKKLTRPSPQQLSDTFQVTSVENNNKELSMDEGTNVESVIITRKNGVTIVRKTSGSLTPEQEYDKVKEVAFHALNEKLPVPPTPMNTPPMTLSEPVIVSMPSTSETMTTSMLSPTSATTMMPPKPKKFQVEAVKEESISEPMRKFSHENAALQQHQQYEAFQNVELSQSYSATLPATKGKVFQVQAVSELQQQAENQISEVNDQLGPLSPTFQVLQTEDRKNMSFDSIDSMLDVMPGRNQTGSDIETGPVTILVSTERKDGGEAVSVGGIPIAGSIPPNAPHSTPYGTPKEAAQRSPIDDIAIMQTQSITSVISDATTPMTTMTQQMMPIDNKIEQAMELVKTHLTYAVREEVDMLKNTILELEYQLRESHYECGFYRKNVSQELIDQAGAYVRQQMQKHTQPSRRASSTVGILNDGAQINLGNSSQASTHMRNLQNQIQQIKQIPPYSQKYEIQHQ